MFNYICMWWGWNVRLVLNESDYAWSELVIEQWNRREWVVGSGMKPSRAEHWPLHISHTHNAGQTDGRTEGRGSLFHYVNNQNQVKNRTLMSSLLPLSPTLITYCSVQCLSAFCPQLLTFHLGAAPKWNPIPFIGHYIWPSSIGPWTKAVYYRV